MYQSIRYFLLETDCTQMASEYRVNTTIFNIHVSEPFISVNSFQKPFGNPQIMETSLLKLLWIIFGMFISFEKLPKGTNACIHV